MLDIASSTGHADGPQYATCHPMIGSKSVQLVRRTRFMLDPRLHCHCLRIGIIAALVLLCQLSTPTTAFAPFLPQQRRPGGVPTVSRPISSFLLASPGGEGEPLDLLTSNTQQASTSTTSTQPLIPVAVDDATQHSYTSAIQRTAAWVTAAVLFGGGIWATAGSTAGEEFAAAYLVEQSLSVDNLFVFLLLFEYFKVPLSCQDKVLNWGIYGAIVMRATMIGLGAAALKRYHAILLLFASILVYSSAQFFIKGDDDEEEDVSENQIVKFSRGLLNSSDDFDGDNFFTTAADGARLATPLFICMIAVEISDVVFAVDSIPAVFGVTENPLIVFSSNIFAIMGLRSLYTILSKAATDLKYLEPAVALVLGFIGSKMIAEYFEYLIPTNVALAVVATLLGTGIGLSVIEKRAEAAESNEE